MTDASSMYVISGISTASQMVNNPLATSSRSSEDSLTNVLALADSQMEWLSSKRLFTPPLANVVTRLRRPHTHHQCLLTDTSRRKSPLRQHTDHVLIHYHSTRAYLAMDCFKEALSSYYQTRRSFVRIAFRVGGRKTKGVGEAQTSFLLAPRSKTQGEKDSWRL